MNRIERRRSGPVRRPVERPRAVRAKESMTAHVGLIVLAAVVGLVVGWFQPPISPYDVARAIHKATRPEPTEAQAVVRQYMDDTRTATFWARPPLMLPWGATRMEQDFAAYDPRRQHAYRRVPLKAWIPDVVHGGVVFGGADFEVIGRVAQSNLIGPISPRLGSWLIQLAPITVRDGMIYCRVNAPLSKRFPAGKYLVARGTVIAVGPSLREDGGYINISYMACSAVARPYGSIGRYTHFLEVTGIDAVRIYEKARSDRQFQELWAREILRTFKERPELIPLRYRARARELVARFEPTST
jgi:hypothetical protein